MSGTIPCMPGEGQIIRRCGPSATDYLCSLMQFLYQRTGFRLDNFRAPGHFKRLLEDLSFNRVPLTVWQNLLAVALKIADTSKTIGHGFQHFCAYFVDVLCWVFNRLSKMGLLKVAIFLLAAEVSPLATMVISLLWFAIEWFLDIFWEELSTFIQSRLITAPYYRLFVGM